MIEVKSKSIGKNKYKITAHINGSDEMIIAEVMALHKQLLKTPRGTNILSTAIDQMQEYMNMKIAEDDHVKDENIAFL